MIEQPHFGRLEKVEDARQGWPTEDRHFTPWLAENLEYLGQELGLILTLTKVEYPVGPFSADLLLRDAQDRVIIVENQFGQTDHDHLGKLPTYWAYTKADVCVWIAESFRDEHTAVLQRLNDTTEMGVRFFAFELELLRIGDSPRAPHLRVV